jgi:flagella basal body P-ring formation protein FlgA
VWREVRVAKGTLKRGDAIADADVARERRDVINLREPLAEFFQGDLALEIAEPLQSGAMLLARSVKLKNVIRRGQLTDAFVEDGTLRVTMKVEALEDGAPGQLIRARNPISRRDLRGKVLNDQTILLSF